MNWLQKLIAKIFGIHETIEQLRKYSSNLERSNKTLIGSMYLPIEQPVSDDGVRRLIDDLAIAGKSKNIQFYLMAIECEVLAAIRDCRMEVVKEIAYQARGQLQIINRFRSDMKNATQNRKIDESNEADVILNKLDAMLHTGMN